MNNWKIIDSFPNYAVSSDGEIKRIVTNKYHPKVRVLKQAFDSDGYRVVTLYAEGKPRVCKVHRIVAQMFLTEDVSRPTVNHKDGNKSNNNINNLELATNAENSIHASRNGLMAFGDRNGMRKFPEIAKRLGHEMAVCRNSKGTANPKAKLTEQDVQEIRLKLKDGEKPSIIARQFNVTKETVYAIRDRKSWSHI